MFPNTNFIWQATEKDDFHVYRHNFITFVYYHSKRDNYSVICHTCAIHELNREICKWQKKNNVIVHEEDFKEVYDHCFEYVSVENKHTPRNSLSKEEIVTLLNSESVFCGFCAKHCAIVHTNHSRYVAEPTNEKLSTFKPSYFIMNEKERNKVEKYIKDIEDGNLYNWLLKVYFANAEKVYKEYMLFDPDFWEILDETRFLHGGTYNLSCELYKRKMNEDYVNPMQRKYVGEQ